MRFSILLDNVNALRNAFEKLNKKAEKFGTESLDFVIIGEPFQEQYDFYVNIEVTGVYPVVGDYKLVSVIEKLDDGTNIIKSVPENELPVEFRDHDFYCDHCGHNRMRKSVVVVQDKDGNYKQVGKTCLKDFLGVELENLIWKFNWVNDLISDANEKGFSKGENLYDVAHFIGLSINSIKFRGYVKSNDDYLTTKDHTSIIYSYPAVTRDQAKIIVDNDLHVVTDETKNLVQNILSWINDLDESSDFNYNLKKICSQSYISRKFLGFVACVYPVYQKHLQKLEEKNTLVKSEYIGEVKERIDITNVKCVFMKEILNQFGVSTMIKFIDSNGNVLVWFASGCVDWCEIGSVFNIKATIKKHSVYNDVKQTELSRVKMLVKA